MQFIKIKKEAGFIEFVDMQTNGRMLSQDKILKETIPIVDFYLIALHSNSPETHDYITSIPGSFSETTLALSKLSKKIDIKKIAIQTVISKANYKNLKKTYKFVHETYGISECNITFPHPLGVAFDTSITPTYSEIKSSVNEALKYCLEVGINPYLEALPFCVFDKTLHEYVLEMYKKEQPDVVGYGGAKDGYIDYNIVLDEGYSKYDSCSKCKFHNICLGVWKEYKQLYPLNDMNSLFTQCD
jgi:sulfatase maturation enzyme AslB (radical SAM superfamily)